jgi:hypothetical protein
MKKKKYESVDSFVTDVINLGDKKLEEGAGFLLFAYKPYEDDRQENSLGAKGKLPQMTECIISAMTKDTALAHIIIAAANAYGHMMMRKVEEAGMIKEDVTKNEDGNGDSEN